MTTKTLHSLSDLSPENLTLLTNYISEQMAAGNCDGIQTNVVRVGVSENLIERNWTTVEAATAWVTFCNSMNPPPTYAVTVS